jgi:hypothetical protein
MHTSCKIGLSIAAIVFGVAANASAADDVLAADIAKGTYDVTGIVTAAASANCTAAGLKKGSAATSTIIYPGAGQLKMTLASPFTAPTGKPGSAATYVCIAVGKVPATGLNGASITFNCWNDTVRGPAKTPTAQIRAKYTVGASHSPSVSQVTAVSSIIVGGKNFCTYTTDSSYILQ